jgi:hypothetical protein
MFEDAGAFGYNIAVRRITSAPGILQRNKVVREADCVADDGEIAIGFDAVKNWQLRRRYSSFSF